MVYGQTGPTGKKLIPGEKGRKEKALLLLRRKKQEGMRLRCLSGARRFNLHPENREREASRNRLWSISKGGGGGGQGCYY